MNKNSHLNLQVLSDKTVISKDKVSPRIVEVSVTALANQDDKPKIPLNISLVLDRSGSMHGEKLHFVKKAAAHVVDLLSEDDRLAIVIYDDRVETLLPSQLVTDQVKKTAKDSIFQIESRASTFLYGGWLQGCRQIAESATENSFNRTLLLTDGLANVGERNIGALSIHAQELFMRGISTSCFGVGLGYDEHLLEAMANHGGGNFHFLETLNAIPHVFEREFDEIMSIALRDVMVKLKLPDSINATVSAEWHHKREDGELTITLGSLPAGIQRSVYVTLNGSSGSDLKIPVKVIGKDVNQDLVEAKTKLAFKSVSDKEEAAFAQDADLMKRFALVDLADKANEALKYERAGDRIRSHQMMQNSLSLHKGHIEQSDFKRYENLASSMRIGLDEADRKRHHYLEYEGKRGFRSIRDYRLKINRGALLAVIDDHPVLLNTRSSGSIGIHHEFFFLKQWYQLDTEQNGLTCEYLSQVYNTPIEMMFGMDILKDLHMILNIKRGLIQISRTPIRFRGIQIPMKTRDSQHYCELAINQTNVNLFIATAQQLNFLSKKVAKGQSPVGVAEELFLGVGNFSTDVYELPVSYDQMQTVMQFGITPEKVQKQYQFSETDGLLGTEFFKHQIVNFAFPDQALKIWL